MVEVLGNLDAEELGDAGGDVHAAGEVGVELEGAQQGNHPEGEALVNLIVVHHAGDKEVQPVGNHQFFEKAPQHQLNSPAEPVRGEGGLLQKFLSQHPVLGDGALENLGEVEDAEEEEQEILLMLLFAPVHIQKIADDGQGVVGQAQGDDYVPGTDGASAQAGQNLVGGGEQSGKILAVAIDQQHHHDSKSGHPPAPFPVTALERHFFFAVGEFRRLLVHLCVDARHPPGTQPGKQSGNQDKNQLLPPGKEVEHYADQEQDDPAGVKGAGMAPGVDPFA